MQHRNNVMPLIYTDDKNVTDNLFAFMVVIINDRADEG